MWSQRSDLLQASTFLGKAADSNVPYNGTLKSSDMRHITIGGFPLKLGYL